jgi:hypothetical protein
VGRTAEPLVIALALWACVACGSPREAAPAPEIEHGSGCVGSLPDRPADAPIAKAYRFEVELWEMPLARAAGLYRAGDPVHASAALLIDERGLEKPLHELEGMDPRVKRFERSAITLEQGQRGLVPARVGGEERALWSDGLRLELTARAPTTKWAAYTLDCAGTWTSPSGERLATLRADTPMPADFGVAVWCLPGQVLADMPEPRTAPAVLALVRIVPLF